MASTLKSLSAHTPAHTPWLQQYPSPPATINGCRLWLTLQPTSWLRVTALVLAWLSGSPPWYPLPYNFSAVAGLVRTTTTSTSSTSQLRTKASASDLSPDSLLQHPLPHTSSAVTGLVPCYYHLFHFLHLIVARHGISISLVTRFPSTASATSHFLSSHTLQHAFPLDLTVAHYGIATGLVTQFPTMTSTTSRFLGGRALGPPLLPPSPPTPHGYMPRHQHRLCHMIPRHGIHYLTLLWQSWAWSSTTTTSSTSSTSQLHAKVSVSALSSVSLLQHLLPLHLMVACHTLSVRLGC